MHVVAQQAQADGESSVQPRTRHFLSSIVTLVHPRMFGTVCVCVCVGGGGGVCVWVGGVYDTLTGQSYVSCLLC